MEKQTLAAVRNALRGKTDEMQTALAELIRIPSVKGEAAPGMPYGEAVAQALACALQRAAALGLSVRDLDGQVGIVEWGEGDFTLGVMAHLDVMPAGEGWHFPPFEATVQDGRMYGRGTNDNKGGAVSALYALWALKECGAKLDGKVRILLGTDEESGWADMAYYTAHEALPDVAVSPDGDYPVVNAEKGLLHLEVRRALSGGGALPRLLALKGGERPNMVPAYAKCVLEYSGGAAADVAARSVQGVRGMQATVQGNRLTLETQGLAAHGSTPWLGVNALHKLMDTLLPLLVGHPDEAVLDWLRRALSQQDGSGLGIAACDEVSGPLTLNWGAVCLEGEMLCAKVDIRHPICLEQGALKKTLQQIFERQGYALHWGHCMAPHYVPADSPLVRTLLEVYERQTGQPAYTRAVGGATYARTMKNAVTFGVNYPDAPHMAHQADEYVALEELLSNAAMLADAMQSLLRECR